MRATLALNGLIQIQRNRQRIIIFSWKKTFSIHPVVYFNGTPVNVTTTHKHFAMKLDSKLFIKIIFIYFISLKSLLTVGIQKQS